MSATTTTKLVPIFIDQQKFELEPGVYTAAQLLQIAGENPAETILVLKLGNELPQLPPNERFELKPGSRFVVFHCDATAVS
jgi:hypothetical protein